MDRALAIVLEAARPLPCEEVPILEAQGRVLQEEVRADDDHPRFDKALMDGYAVIASDLEGLPRTLQVIEEIPAGRDPESLSRVVPGSASRIMTGAPIPPGADAVLMVEESEPAPGDPGSVRAKARVKAGDNLAPRGNDVRLGEVLLAPGEFVGPAEIAVLAACGRTRARVARRPRVAVLATGDELVEPERTPAPGQIRNSNGALLTALARRAGAEVHYLGIAPDDDVLLRRLIARGLEADLLLLSGGVSMGVYDLVGGALRALGAEVRFERVMIKPGKPFTFATRGATLVFGCPGNPVSSYVIFQVFARPALRRMTGVPRPSPPPVRATLVAPLRQRAGRTGFHQARVRWTGSGYEVEVLPTSGSADFVSCARGNALAIVPAETTALAAGDSIEVLLLDDHADR
ncbi:MAG TPA: gephyrin-like molybdotransferase Glp [Candidatus Polarisedimenticolia bacterium]|nr:gephyrin-like molybdotransferase Glp [Candidatus Polarisedimenticolia bacterium]